MGLMDEISAHNAPQPRSCVIGSTLSELDAKDAADLEACLADPGITHAAIAKALSNRGFKVHPAGKQVARHRKGECECDR